MGKREFFQQMVLEKLEVSTNTHTKKNVPCTGTKHYCKLMFIQVWFTSRCIKRLWWSLMVSLAHSRCSAKVPQQWLPLIFIQLLKLIINVCIPLCCLWNFCPKWCDQWKVSAACAEPVSAATPHLLPPHPLHMLTLQWNTQHSEREMPPWFLSWV